MSVSLVRQASNGLASTSTGITVTIVAAAVGNVLAVFVANNGAPPTVTGITCTNVTFSRLAGNSAVENCEIWWGIVTGGSSGTSVAVSMTAGTIALTAQVAEFNSTTGWGVGDGGTGNSGIGSSTATSGSYTSTGASDLILAAVGMTGAGTTAGSPGGIFTDVSATINTSNANLKADFGVAASGAHSASWALSVAVNWGTGIGGIKLGVPVVDNLEWVTSEILFENEVGEIVDRIVGRI